MSAHIEPRRLKTSVNIEPTWTKLTKYILLKEIKSVRLSLHEREIKIIKSKESNVNKEATETMIKIQLESSIIELLKTPSYRKTSKVIL